MATILFNNFNGYILNFLIQQNWFHEFWSFEQEDDFFKV
jgi:hypothetical protein